MTTSAIASQGVSLTRDGHAIAELDKVGGIEVSRTLIDVTSHDSTGGYKEFIPGLKDAGEMEIEGNFIAGDTDGQIGLHTDFEAGTLQDFVFTFPSAITATWTFKAWVIKYKPGDFPIEGKVPFTATLKISGMPVLAIGVATGPSALVVTGNVTGALTLTPAYDDEKYSYLADGSGDASVTVTVTAAGADTITVNGTAVTSGSPSGAITLTVADITTITVVVGETGKVSKTYVIQIIGPAA